MDEWLEMRGAAILRAFSTAHALELMKRARMNVVISDLARNEGNCSIRWPAWNWRGRSVTAAAMYHW